MVENGAPRGEIFVVDDDPAVRETLSVVLSTAGYKVICFADGAALLATERVSWTAAGQPIEPPRGGYQHF